MGNQCSHDSVQRVVVFQERGSGEKKIAGIELYTPGRFELEVISIDDPLPALLDEPEKYLPTEFKADLVLAPGNRIRIELAVSDEGILEVLSEWGNDNFLEEEIEALWKTWKPSIMTRCIQDEEVIVLFPLTDQQVESISTIDLQTDQGYSVEYSRLFLALGSV